MVLDISQSETISFHRRELFFDSKGRCFEVHHGKWKDKRGKWHEINETRRVKG